MNGVERVAERLLAGEGVGCMSCGEQIAAAFLCGRGDFLPEAYKIPADAQRRLGPDWSLDVAEYIKNHGHVIVTEEKHTKKPHKRR